MYQLGQWSTGDSRLGVSRRLISGEASLLRAQLRRDGRRAHFVCCQFIILRYGPSSLAYRLSPTVAE
ncbi:hypothetical protein CCM_02013 [Cordyceps militaris CM01]|uniref:Uncharacterized protein n=1 Tax=Cordyceps militaris (strain CM01) TaxID=983644 RepID=G3JC26_CORMM|nr:uncharacterized protein CCM_02013 [Cordyceps militaris CM01]EGX93744.1 hypothetical protein CCM_02013 [Cordyceps militaris CM01]